MNNIQKYTCTDVDSEQQFKTIYIIKNDVSGHVEL